MRKQLALVLITAMLAAATVMLAAAGCGGKSGGKASSRPVPSTNAASSQPSSSAKLIAAADAICGRLNGELVVSKPKNPAPREIARSAPRNAPLELKAVTALVKLRPPASLARDWRRIIAYRRTLAQELAKLGRAAKANDRAGIKALEASKKRVHQELFKTASRDGFKVCPSLVSSKLRSGASPRRPAPGGPNASPSGPKATPAGPKATPARPTNASPGKAEPLSSAARS